MKKFSEYISCHLFSHQDKKTSDIANRSTQANADDYRTAVKPGDQRALCGFQDIKPESIPVKSHGFVNVL